MRIGLSGRLNGIAGASVAMILAVAFCAPIVLAQAAQGQNEERFEKSFPISAGGTVVVENRKGTIHVTGSDTNQVTVNVYKRFEGGSDRERREWLADTRVNFDAQANHLAVTVEYPNFNCVFCTVVSDGVELTIAVPRKTNLELDGTRPDMEIASIEGSIRISSNRSAISIRSTSGAIRIETNRGNVRLEDVAIKGRLELTSNRAEAEIDAKSLAGEVDLETERGSIALRMPSTVGANLEYEGGRRANFHCDFPVTTNQNGAELRDVHGRMNRAGAHVSGTLNQGGPRMLLRTERGRISIEKGS